jgi:hypothetical protein
MGEIERGESNVTIQTLKIIVDALKVKIVDRSPGCRTPTMPTAAEPISGDNARLAACNRSCFVVAFNTPPRVS